MRRPAATATTISTNRFDELNQLHRFYDFSSFLTIAIPIWEAFNALGVILLRHHILARLASLLGHSPTTNLASETFWSEEWCCESLLISASIQLHDFLTPSITLSV
jgi:hypothetical protein